jgi:hypothetical protein
MSIESAVEKRIREAMERGEFDNLPGKGKPIDLEAYFNTPEDLRMAYAMLRSNEFVPVEVETMKQIEDVRARLKRTTDEIERQNLTKEINEKSLALRMALDARRRKK